MTYLTSSLPGVVVALAMTTVAVRWLSRSTRPRLAVAAYVILFLPRALVNLRAGIAQTPPAFDESARALGASGLGELWRFRCP